MGQQRQVERAAKHNSGIFDQRKLEIEQKKIRIPFNLRIYFRNGSSSVKKAWIGGTTSVSERISGFVSQNPEARILMTKRSTCVRWRKPEHPIAARRRIKEMQKRGKA